MYNNARIFLFPGKDRCGSSFPPLSFWLPECLSARLKRKLSGPEGKAGLSGNLRRKVHEPDRPKKIFPRQRVKKIDKFVFCCYLKREGNIFGKNGFPPFSTPGFIPGKSKPVGTYRLHFFHQRKRV